MAAEMNILTRLTGQTPRFFKKLRNVGKALVVLGGALVVPPVGIPLAIGAVITAIGGTIITVSSLAIEDDPEKEKEETNEQ